MNLNKLLIKLGMRKKWHIGTILELDNGVKCYDPSDLCAIKGQRRTSENCWYGDCIVEWGTKVVVADEPFDDIGGGYYIEVSVYGEPTLIRLTDLINYGVVVA